MGYVSSLEGRCIFRFQNMKQFNVSSWCFKNDHQRVLNKHHSWPGYFLGGDIWMTRCYMSVHCRSSSTSITLQFCLMQPHGKIPFPTTQTSTLQQTKMAIESINLVPLVKYSNLQLKMPGLSKPTMMSFGVSPPTSSFASHLPPRVPRVSKPQVFAPRRNEMRLPWRWNPWVPTLHVN